ncbi:uncharacterized protein LOC127842900 [Dreissena polymorpha]|uniref:Uncharacterized protein n=1 Tax=Dreissena polymorpha TaxID=45954 RepID=A0A9D4EFN2_DREPO|nr:uncharacterized protein LOC127842900 [Dreissena polymorpha]KAH3779487.1 hypothetical protein DPMN_157290 [Dreissena polymorpha]
MADKKKNSSITPVELMEVCARRQPQKNMMDNIPFCQQCHNKFGFKVFVFLLVLCLDAADLVSDWLLFRDVWSAKEGLVYGPPEDAVKYSLMAFSILGTLTFIFEISNLWWEIFRRNPWMDVDLLSAIVVWIEDVPQIAINVVIVACREEAISYFQLVKASLIIVGAVIRIIVTLVRYCSKSARKDLECAKVNTESRRHVVYRVFIMLGLFVTLGGAITIFLFTQSERNPDGSLNFKVPHRIVEGEFDDQKYFTNVSIYFSHSYFDYEANPSAGSKNLIRLIKLNDIKSTNNDKSVHIEYDGTYKFQILVDGQKECYAISKSTTQVTRETPCSALINPQQFAFTFHFIKPSVPSLIFGDITYALKTGTSTNCETPTFKVVDNLATLMNDPYSALLRYYRTKPGVTEDNHISKTSTTLQFYHASDLIDIADVWKTGFAYCKSSGSPAPHKGDNLNVKCL